MFKSSVQYILIVIVAIIAYVYLGEFFVYFGQPVYVNSVFGTVRGRVSKARGGREIYSFTIPYGKPPTVDEGLRFQPPVAFESWGDEILDATVPLKPCLQYDAFWKQIVGVEDCLQLHVYTPNVDRSKPLFPVMVWFHGGEFMYGANDIFGPEYLLEDGDVVVITVNYRLGALGFLNTGDGAIAGNQGLKDQTLALKWINKAIKEFGGDPDRVTIFGSSAGAASVQLHMIAPMSKGLFHRGISQSGSALCPWGFTRDPKSQALRLAAKLNCSISSSDTSASLVKCLQKKSSLEIVSVHKEISDVFHDVDAVFGPTIEKVDPSMSTKGSVFLSDSPYALLKANKFEHVPWIVGVTSEEGCFRTPYVLPREDKLSSLNEKWSAVAPKTLMLCNDDPSLSAKIKDFYFGKKKENMKQKHQIGWNELENLTNMYSDRLFLSCAREAAILHARYAPVHMYYYTYKPEIGFGYIVETLTGNIPLQLEIILGYLKFHLYRDVLKWPLNDYGVCHTDELQSLFYTSPLLWWDTNSPHYSFSREMVKLWISFATMGKPGDFNGVSWTPLQFDKNANTTVTPLQYLRLGKVPAMIDEPFTARLKFWESLNLPTN